MSGDVQPRKRKDKKKKKDEAAIIAPAEEAVFVGGTAAIFGEGDVFIHSHSDHGTGGHWCAKIIFFSLLAVLIMLIGLIILENRGLSELEANSVESRYSGVLEGWLEDAADDDHHDVHTLELKHHDEDESNEDDHEDEEDEIEVEKIEQEVIDEEPISLDLPVLPEADDDNDDKDGDGDDDNHGDDDGEDDKSKDDEADDSDDDDADDFLENDIDVEQPIVERFVVPSGKPYQEIDEDDDISNERPVDTLLEEEEYEKEQEKLRKEEEQASHTDENEEEDTPEEIPAASDRRQTLIPEHTVIPSKISPVLEAVNLNPIFHQIPSITKSAPTPRQLSLDDQEIQMEEQVENLEEEPAEEVCDEVDMNECEETKYTEQEELAQEKDEDNQEDQEDDEEIEIIDEGQIEEEQLEEEQLEEEVVEEEDEISDVDDAELLSRLEAKYGRLPEPDRPSTNKDGGNSVDDLWPGEPVDNFWKQEVNKAEDELNQGLWSVAVERASQPSLSTSARARYITANSYDAMAESQRDNKLLTSAINAYLELLKMNERLTDKRLKLITERTINRMNFRGTYLSAEPVHRLLIRRFPDDPAYRNNLTITYLMANRADLAMDVLIETLQRWPDDRIALAHYGFVLKTLHNRYDDAITYLSKALEGDDSSVNDPRFYYHLGDALLLTGRSDEAQLVHERAAELGFFLSASQRSLYNVNRLKSQPWWNIDETPYRKLARSLENSWREILKEGLNAHELYEQEKEGLKEKGDWSQLDLFVRGREVPGRCKKAPVTCSILRSESAAVGCRRGQIKFSAMKAGTHVRPHVGPTNCRLRMHLALSNTKDTFIRVDKETRQWIEGKAFLFDDSFEHEVWHNGTSTRLVLIVDLWHPELTAQERAQLPAI